ncbi:MAG: hypothetical protein HXK68_01755 [Clostridiales bacterium]|nr:hypothetical protein [Clostridiales bacterium]
MKKTNTGKKKKVNKFTFFCILVVFILVISYVMIGIIGLMKNPSSTVIVKEGTVTKEETVTGVIIRDETIVQGKNLKNGMQHIVDEGEKVAVGDPIFRYFSTDESQTKSKIAELDNKINLAISENNQILYSSSTKLIDSQILEKIKELPEINSVQILKENKRNVSSLILKKAKLAGDLSPTGSTLKQLINERSKLEKQIADGAEYIKAEKSGIVSYRIDGFEEKLTNDDFSKYTKDYIKKLNLKVGDIVPVNSEKGKIINNFKCYIAVISKTQEAKTAKEGQKLSIVLPNAQMVKGKIVRINREGNNGDVVLIIEFDEGIESLSIYRSIRVDLVWWNKVGNKIPNSAIFNVNGLSYVIRSNNGYNDYVLVKILKQSDDYSIVSNYSLVELKELNLKQNISTSLLLYDEVVLNPSVALKNAIN